METSTTRISWRPNASRGWQSTIRDWWASQLTRRVRCYANSCGWCLRTRSQYASWHAAWTSWPGSLASTAHGCATGDWHRRCFPCGGASKILATWEITTWRRSPAPSCWRRSRTRLKEARGEETNMTQIRPIEVRDAERVRDLWLQMCAEAGTPLPAASSQLILANLRQYATHQSVHCFVAEEQQTIIGFVTCWVSGHPVMP